MAKLTVAALIEQAKKPKKPQTAALNIPSLGGEIIVQPPDLDTFSDAIGMERGNDEYLIYCCVVEPNLKDPELQKAYGCSEPTDIVRKVFAAGEVKQIATRLLDIGGYRDTVKLVDEIKNE